MVGSEVLADHGGAFVQLGSFSLLLWCTVEEWASTVELSGQFAGQ